MSHWHTQEHRPSIYLCLFRSIGHSGHTGTNEFFRRQTYGVIHVHFSWRSVIICWHFYICLTIHCGVGAKLVKIFRKERSGLQTVGGSLSMQFILFSYSFRQKSSQILSCGPKLRDWGPPPPFGKSRICHCKRRLFSIFIRPNQFHFSCTLQLMESHLSWTRNIHSTQPNSTPILCWSNYEVTAGVDFWDEGLLLSLCPRQMMCENTFDMSYKLYTHQQVVLFPSIFSEQWHI